MLHETVSVLSSHPTTSQKRDTLRAAEAGKKTAILYTILESCRHRGIDPLAFLHDVLTRIPRYTNHTVHELTPENCAKARAAFQKQYAAAA
jgi:transposase